MKMYCTGSDFCHVDIQRSYGNTKEGLPNQKKEFSEIPHKR
jgi:hypothetical protein